MTNPRTEPAPQRDDLPVLTGDRVLLRGYSHADLDDFYAVHSDPLAMRYWSFPAWTDLAQAQPYFDSAVGGRDAEVRLCWAIAQRDNPRVMGGVTLFAIHRAQGRAEIGFMLGSGHWNRGYAQEAVRLVLDHAFDTLQLRRIEADVDPRNLSSCRLLQRLGFKREGVLHERWQVGDEVQDSAIHGLLARDWRAARDGLP